MSPNERNPRDRAVAPQPDPSAIESTPKGAAARELSTVPLGRRRAIPAVKCVEVAAAPEKSAAPVTAAAPAVRQLAPAQRAGLWETVVGVGPAIFLRGLGSAAPSSRRQRRAPATPAPKRAAAAPAPKPVTPALKQAVSAPKHAAPKAAAPAPKPAVAAPASTPRSTDAARASAQPAASNFDALATQVSRGSAQLAAVALDVPQVVVRSRSVPASGAVASAAVASAAASLPAAAPSSPPTPSVSERSKPSPDSKARPASRPGLFRKAALDAARGTTSAELDLLAGFKPKNWSVLLVLVSFVGLLFAGASLATIEVTAQATGVLRAPRGLRPVASVVSGAISEVLVQSGDHVEAGQVVARLEATELRASLVNRERALETSRQAVATAARRDREIEERASLAMQQRHAALQGRIGINNERLVQRRQQSENYTVLVREGGASENESLTAKEALQAASESVSQLNAELAQLDLEIADRARQWQEREAARHLELSRAEADVEEARTLLAATEIHAPAAGQIESLLASAGGVVEAGGLLANIVPGGAPRTIVAFVQSRDIAFVTPGATATVEVQSLPISEFGLAQARVVRISSDVATPAEIQSTLGEALPGAVVRVELELTASESSARMAPLLRSGDRVLVRLHRRQRRVLHLLFDFMRHWSS